MPSVATDPAPQAVIDGSELPTQTITANLIEFCAQLAEDLPVMEPKLAYDERTAYAIARRLRQLITPIH